MIHTDAETMDNGIEVAYDFSFSREDFVAVLQPHGNAYKYSVRDLRGEGPTIHGIGADFPQALSNVTRLLDALTGATD